MAKSMFNNQRGIITLEILIAMAIMVLVVSSVTSIVFSNQKITTDTLTNNEALFYAQQNVDALQTAALTNFASITTSSYGISSGPIMYTGNNTVSDISPCLKQVNTKLTWSTESRPQYSELKTLLSSPTEALAMGGDCNTDLSIGGWTIPQTLLSRDLNYHAAYGDVTTLNSDNGTKATGLDVLDKIIYMTATSTSNKDTFFIFDGSNVLNGTIPPIVGSLNLSSDLNAVDVIHDASSTNTYAYVVGYFEDPVGSCGHGVHRPYIKQLQIINVTNINAPFLVNSKTLSAVSSCGSFPAGFSIYYYNKKIYVGTKETSGSELTIFDATIADNPSEIANIPVGRNVNAILVHNGLAYLATGPGAPGIMNPLKVYDVDPSHVSPNPIQTYLQQVNSFTATGDEEGISLFLLGNQLYFGLERAAGGRPDFYILNASTLATIGSKNLALSSGSAVTGIFVSGKYAFLTISDPNFGFGVLDISTPSLPGSVSKYNYSQNATGIDYEGGFIYTSNQRNDALRIIRPAQCADKIDDDGDGKIDSADPQCHTDGNANNLNSYNPEDDNE